MTRHDHPFDRTHETAEGAEVPLTLQEIVEQLPDPTVDVHRSAVANIDAARVRRLVRSLPVLERHVIVARYGLVGPPLSCRQAAAKLGLPRSSVSAIEHRALEHLRGLWGIPEAA